MKADYNKVRSDFKQKRTGKYFTLKDRRYRANGKTPIEPSTK
jgi:hypothetical protein